MSEREINIAIAEARGWTDTPIVDGKYGQADVPDYCNDLNAMHEAEQTLWRMDWRFRDEFIDHLARVINPIHGYRMQEGIDLLDATAKQRAEAFLRTLGKWEETK